MSLSEYERVYNQQTEIDELRKEVRSLEVAAQAFYANLFAAAQKAAKKAMKTRQRSTVTLPDEIIEALQEQTFAEFPRLKILHTTIPEKIKDRNDRLYELAPKTKLDGQGRATDKLRTVKTGMLYSFSSQTQPTFYALATLKPLAWKLTSLGFFVQVATTEGGYALQSNAELWEADCADKDISVKEALNAMGRCVNPFVIYTNLFPQVLADKHYAESGSGFPLKVVDRPSE